MPAQGDVTLQVGLTLGDVTQAANDLKQRLESIFAASSGKNLSIEMQQLLNTLIQDYNQLNAMQQSLETLANTEIVPKDYQKALDKYGDAKVELDKATASAELLRAKIEQVTKEVTIAPEQTGDWASYKNQIEQATEQYAKLSVSANDTEQQLHRAETTLKRFTTIANNNGTERNVAIMNKWSAIVGTLQTKLRDYNIQMDNLEKEANKSAAGLQHLKQQGGWIKTEDWVTIQKLNDELAVYEEQMKTAGAVVEESKNKMQELDDAGKGIKLGSDTEQFTNKLQSFSQQVNRSTVDVRKFGEATGEKTLAGIAQPWQLLINVINQGPKAIANFADSIVRLLPPAVQVAYAAIKRLISLSFQFAKELTGAFKKVATKAINVANVALKALLKTLTKIASATILKPIKKLGDAFANIGKSAQNTTPNLKQIGRMFLQYGLGARSLYRLINKLRTALFEGFETLANAYQPFNASMSQIMTSLEYLKNSFAAAFAPIIQTVAPALSLFINQVANAVQMVGQFIAALTGKEFVMAMPVYQNYAENSKTGAAAAKEAAKAETAAAKAEKARAKALKEVQRTIAGFDDVEILKEPTSSSSDTGSSAMPDTPTLNSIATTFKTAPIQSALQNFADLIKKAWLEADFYDIGQLLSQQLGKALKAFNDNVPEIEKFVRRVASSIATFIAGFLSVNETFIQLGKALGNIINLIFAFLQEFLIKFEKYDGFKNLGKDIFLVIYNALATIKWDVIFDVFARLGRGIATTLNEVLTKPALWQQIFLTLCNGIKAVLLMFYNFVLNLHWDEIGTAFGEGINTAIANYPLELLAKTAAKFVNGIFTAIGNAARKIQWAQLGKNIADSIMLFFRKVHWRENGENFGSFVQGIFNALKTFVDNMHFDEIAQDIVNFIQGFFSKFRWEQNLTTLANFLNGLLDGLRTIVGPINWGDVGRKIVDSIVWFFDHFHWEEAIDTFFDLIEGLVELLFTVVSDSRVQEVGAKIIGKIKEKLESPEWKETTTRLWNLFMYWLEFKVLQLVAKNGPLWVVAGTVLGGLVKGFITNMPFSAEWFRTYLIDPFLKNIRSSFGIKDDESGASETKPVGIATIMGIVHGILENIPFTPDWFDKHIFSKVKSGLDESFGIEDGQSMNLFTVGKAIVKGITGGVNKEEPNLNTKTASVNKQTQKNLSAGNWSGIGGPTIIGGITSGLNSFSGGLYTLTNGINSNVFTKLSAGDWFGIGSKTMIGNTQSGMSNQSRNIQNTAAIINTGLFRNLSAGNWSNIGSKTMVAGVQSGMNAQNRYIQSMAQTINSGIFRNLQAGNWTNMGYSLVNATRTGMYNGQNLAINQARNIQSSIYSALNSGNYNAVGSNITNNLAYGLQYNSYQATNIASNLANDIGYSLDTVNGYNIGSNIAYGIYQGLDSNWSWLSNTAWNLAVSLYNSACNALGIASPSKVFADKVGAMIPAGIAVGINANSDIATKSIDNMTDSIVDSAMGIKIPPIAMGEIIPYNTDAPEESANTLKGVLSVLQSLEDNTVKRDELEEILTNVIRSNVNIDFYIGDEKLARHTNRGNSLIDRRYNAVSTT